jgi:UDP-N-acetylmuramoyl-L-alanyl-D-glutamate--2,6-diaminopimelate ligase
MHWWQDVPEAAALGAVPDVADLTHDSRRAGPGTAFAAVPGRRFDGHAFLQAAVGAGAPACVVEASRRELWAPFEGRVPLVVVPDVRRALGHLAAAVHGNPSATLRTVGVTGTDGKTTTTHLIAHVMDACGFRAGCLSSTGFITGNGLELNATHMTTVEATTIQSLLATALRNGRETMVVEASSEGLAQGRLNGCLPDVAVFTNLSRDHLDFHGTMENYREAKGLLFEMLELTSGKRFPKAAIVNADDEASAHMISRTRAPVTTYGVDGEADYRAQDLRPEGFDLRFEVRAEGRAVAALAPLIGQFNAYNCLAAVACACSQGAGLSEAVEALKSFPGIPGRLEPIGAGQPFSVFVDIASTPAAMENVLNALRPGTTGRLWVMFGAAGGRDTARRDGLGRVAGQLADRCVLTNEDPRDEDPDAIIDAIAVALRGCGRIEGTEFERIPDRREAMQFVFEHAAAGDTVLLAGKATEPTMDFASGPVAWDERAVARELLGSGRGA